MTMRLIPGLAIMLIGSMLALPATGEQQHSIDSETGIESWETHNDGVTFSLTQILPDQARAFYVNRGFGLEQIEEYATSCIYMTVIRNESAEAIIHFKLDDWMIESGGKQSRPLSIESWQNQLKATGAPRPAMIAFRWAQFPPEQEYEPGGDWNQGMLTTGLEPGAQFDITARWDMNNKLYEGTLKNVRCAE